MTLAPTLGGGLRMKANVGDRLITEGVEGSQRECLIIRLQHADGSPPYVVRWLSDGHIALVFPGPYTRLVHCEDHRRRGDNRGGNPPAGNPPAGSHPGR
jgi:Domain of unknown function (DUF1918)